MNPKTVIEKSRLEKIVVNSGFGRLATQSNFKDKVLPGLIREFAAITGQKPQTRPAKKSISGFKLRANEIIGLRVTLRGKRMVQFLNKITQLVLPRIRDFRGIDPETIDEGGNLNIGIKEQWVFPEIIPENSPVNFGLQITIVPKKGGNRKEAVLLYQKIGIPLKKD